MNRFKLLLALILLGAGIFSAQAGATSNLTKTRLARSKAVVPGYWHSDLAKCQDYAKKNGVPLIAVWSNGDLCGHCVSFEQAAVHSVFTKWMKSSGCVFFFAHSGDSFGKENGSAYNFCWGSGKSLGAFPFVRVWWYTNNGKTKKLDTAATGDTIDGGVGGKSGATKAVAWFKKKLKNFNPVAPVVVPKYTGGEFDFGNTENDRLEAELGATTSVEVNFSRTNAVAATAMSTNVFVSAVMDGPAVTNVIYWDAGQAATNFAVDVSMLTSAVQHVTLTLLDDKGAKKEERQICAVDPVANSPANPFWIGEKTVDELAWGEWTMDIDVATNKVAAYNLANGVLRTVPLDRAYTLVLLEGALWCPDCKRTDEFLLDRPEFKQWACSNKVALVALDLARGDATAKIATLLTHQMGGSYNASGSAYLSRKGIDRAEALAVLARNFEIAQQLRLPNWSNTTRPPVPSFFLLRDDGRIASRLQYFGGVASPTNAVDVAAHIKRFDEMLAQIDEDGEELNDTVFRTEETIGKHVSITSTVSAIDNTDAYRLLPAESFGKRLKFKVEGDEDATFEVKVVNVSGSHSATITNVTGKLSEGIEVSTSVLSSNCCVTVGYLQDLIPGTDKKIPHDALFAITNAGSTLCTYALSTDFVVEPKEVADEVVVDGSTLTMALVSNQVYRITGLAENSSVLAPIEGTTDRYRALVDGDVALALSGSTCVNQLWNPGKVGFATTSASAAEAAGSYVLRLVRTGGVSGRATAMLSLNTVKSSKLDNLVELPTFEELVWEEGDATEKSVKIGILDNPFSDGDQVLYFDAVVSGDAEPGSTQFRLSLRDNDKKVAGRIAIVDTVRSMAKTMTTFVRADDSLNIMLGRTGGADGELHGTLTTTLGTLNEPEQTWIGRDTADKIVTLTGLEGAAGKKAKVALVPAKGTSVDTTRRILEVTILDKDVPGFASNVCAIAAQRYVPIAKQTIALDDKATAATTIKKYSGTLAPGLTWKQDGQNLVIAGVPTKAGAFTAVFRAYNETKAGLTVAVDVTVGDPAVASGTDVAVNPSVVKTRTYSDVPVYDCEKGRLAGLLTLTLPRTGRASAKYRPVGLAAVSLSCASWSALGSDGKLSAELVGKADANIYRLTVQASADGTVSAALEDPLRVGGVTCEIPQNIWSKENPATDFKGYYTVDLVRTNALSGSVLATGDGYLTLKMNTTSTINSGKFTFAGKLPNGAAVSGSARLTPADWKDGEGFKFWARGLVPVVQTGSTDEFAVLLQLTPGAYDSKAQDSDGNFATGRCYYKTVRRTVRTADEGGAYWRHTGKTAETSCEVLFEAFGCYYDVKENFANCCAAALGTTKLKFFVLPGLNDLEEEVLDGLDGFEIDTTVWPETAAAVGVNVVYDTKSKVNKLSIANTKSTKLSSFSFAHATGIVSGSFTVDGVKMMFNGVAMPGWGSQSCTSCGTGGAEAQLRPFITGTAWFNDMYRWVDERGRDRSETVRRSCAISIGVNAGE